MAAPINDDYVRKNLEVSFITLSRPSLNETVGSVKLLLFWKGITWQFYSFNL